MAINKKSLSHRIIDNVFGFIFKNIYRFLWFIQCRTGKWFCPENSLTHFSDADACECKRYCHKHDRDEKTGCSVCEALKFNYKEFPNYVLDIHLSRVQNGFPLNDQQSQVEEEFYLMNKNKYFA